MEQYWMRCSLEQIGRFKKYQKATPPKPVWNLKGDALKQYYKSEFMRLAAQDKKPVLGISGVDTRQLILLSIPTSDRTEFVRRLLVERYHHLSNTHCKPVIVTDHGKCYDCVDGFVNMYHEPMFQHEICRHDKNKYKSENGYSSNRLEGSLSHLKRMWRGVYQMWSDKYNQLYLNEFAWRFTYREHSLWDKLVMLFRDF